MKNKKKKNNKTLYIIIGTAVVAAIVVTILCVIFLRDDEEEVITTPLENTNEGVVQDSTYEDLSITDITVTVEEDYSVFNATVTNNTSETKDITQFNIVLKDEDGNEVAILLAYLGDSLEPGESAEVLASTSTLLTEDVAYTAEYQEYTETTE